MSERHIAWLAAFAALAPTAAYAQNSAFYVPDSTWAAEDMPEGSDEDQNDVVFRYNKRCIVANATEDLVAEEVRFTPVAAGASRTNTLVLRFETPADTVRMSDDGGGTWRTLCAGDCGTSITLYDDFEDGFDGGGGLVNTTGGNLAPGRQHVVAATYAAGVPAPTDGQGALYCALPDFAIERPDLASPIDRDAVIADNLQPLVGSFVDFCPPPQTTCPSTPLVPWAVPLEQHAMSEVYGARFLTWLTDLTSSPGCTPGECAEEDWYKFPVDSYLDGALLGAVPGLQPAPTCDDLAANGDETDADCGGTICEACADGLSCAVDSDCLSADCNGGSCGITTDGLCSDDAGDTDCDGSCDLGDSPTGPDCFIECLPGVHDPSCACDPGDWTTLLSAPATGPGNVPNSPALGVGPDGTAWLAAQVMAGAGVSWNVYTTYTGDPAATLDEAFTPTGPFQPSGSQWSPTLLSGGVVDVAGLFTSTNAATSWFVRATDDGALSSWTTAATTASSSLALQGTSPDGHRWNPGANCSTVTRLDADGTNPVSFPTGLPSAGCSVERFAVDPVGRLYLAVSVYSPEPQRTKVVTSTNGGASWTVTLDVLKPRGIFFYPKLFTDAAGAWVLAVDYAWNGSVTSDGRIYAYQSVGGGAFTPRLSAWGYGGQLSPAFGATYGAFPFTMGGVDYLFLSPGNNSGPQRRAVLRLSDQQIVYDVAVASGPAPYDNPEPVRDANGRVLFLGKNPANGNQLTVWETTTGTSFTAGATIPISAPAFAHAMALPDGLLGTYVQGNTVRVVRYTSGPTSEVASIGLIRPWDAYARPTAIGFDGDDPVVLGLVGQSQAQLRGRAPNGSWGLLGNPFQAGFGGEVAIPDVVVGGGGNYLLSPQSAMFGASYSVWKSNDSGASWFEDYLSFQIDTVSALEAGPGGTVLVAGFASTGSSCSWKLFEVADPYAPTSAATVPIDDFVFEPSGGGFDFRCMGSGTSAPAFWPTDIAIGPDGVIWVTGLAQAGDWMTWHRILRRGTTTPGSWQTVRNDALPDWNVGPSAVAVDGFGRIYVSSSNWSLLRSDDDGQSWVEVGGGFPDASYNTRSGLDRLAIGPDDSVYAAGHTSAGGTSVLLRQLECIPPSP